MSILISKNNNMQIFKNDDYHYRIYFESMYDPSSNLFQIIDNKLIGQLLFELNKDLIQDYKKYEDYELYIFKKTNELQDTNHYLYFKNNVKNVDHNNKKINLTILELKNSDFLKIQMKELNLFIKIENNKKINIDVSLVYDEELSQFKIDAALYLIEKIFFRFKNYVSSS